jgi:hypothetical protein
LTSSAAMANMFERGNVFDEFMGVAEGTIVLNDNLRIPFNSWALGPISPI